MKGTAWRLYLGVGALATGAYYLPPERAGAVLNVVVGASAAAAIAVGVRWHRPARRLAWWLIAAAQRPVSARLPGAGRRPGPARPQPLGRPRLGRADRRGRDRHRLRPAVVGPGHGPLLQRPVP